MDTSAAAAMTNDDTAVLAANFLTIFTRNAPQPQSATIKTLLKSYHLSTAPERLRKDSPNL